MSDKQDREQAAPKPVESLGKEEMLGQLRSSLGKLNGLLVGAIEDKDPKRAHVLVTLLKEMSEAYKNVSE